ncbi:MULTISPECIES: hypothetical protein [unclassified Xanthomonas]|uniref:hypothetical protein n=1 Tax=unclassified Xanthomonas TaxID=2643310 RepID=UPI002B239C29|nr:MULTISPECIES: hypothetical protein [unclassified Xanthomonas]MEA9562858.1 hypothetical protein [Xanthomonas sp. WHRI 8932A]MEA9633911.1 hypothetical protein [Xanthomonas sp. WHRI 8812E]
MNVFVKILTVLASVVAGAMASVVIASTYVSATYSCLPAPGEPCDAGGYTGLSMAILLTPVLSMLFALFGYWLIVRYQRQLDAE